jgi:hypothetical protein
MILWNRAGSAGPASPGDKRLERHGRPRPEEAAFPFKLAVALGGVDAAIVGFVLC